VHDALALTFDNLGEAADLERGLWPAGAPLGRHPSVTVVLPRLLDELAALGLRATFCVEALNCELYPDAIRAIAAGGHEVALHGWRHERWDALPAAREDELLGRGREAFAALGIDVRGFRPPGGALTERSRALLERHGLRWCSPAGERRERRDGLACVPFAWGLVDAYHVLESFAERRAALGDQAEPLAPGAAAARLLERLAAGGPPTIILHPFLMAGEGGWAAARRVLEQVGAGSRWVATVGEIAAEL
jgi:peptidoglycan/xylan/chitin deacetylase (PgdA/CDA1 family)